LEGLGQLLRNVSLVQQNINSGLRLSGIVMTMFDPRTKLSEQVVQEVQRHFGDLVYGVIIPRTVRLSEAPGFGQPITVYDPKSKGAEAYRQLAREVALRPPPDKPMPQFEEMPIAVMTPIVDVPVDEPAVGPEPVTRVPDVAEQGEEGEGTTAPPEPEAAPEPARRPAPRAHVDVPTRTESEPAMRPEPAPEPAEEDLWEEPPLEPEPRVKAPSSPAPPGELPQRRVVVIDENPDIDIEAGQEEPPPPPGSSEPREGMADIGATLDDERGRKRRWRMFRKGGD
ncbi:MAG TPA: ParA family protein, partial [Actinomycetota bacterium]|nr:ParA family protein [Actinomycetota bacterium]